MLQGTNLATCTLLLGALVALTTMSASPPLDPELALGATAASDGLGDPCPVNSDETDGMAGTALEGELYIELEHVSTFDLIGDWRTTPAAWGTVSTPGSGSGHAVVVEWNSGRLKSYLVRLDTKVAVTPWAIIILDADTEIETAGGIAQPGSAMRGNDKQYTNSDISTVRFTGGCWGNFNDYNSATGTYTRWCNADNDMECVLQIVTTNGKETYYTFTCDGSPGNGFDRQATISWVFNFLTCGETPPER